ncbi:FAD-dependent oxidoreductase [Nocardioides insulae]|uniref:FAD-dependent oxidoreductase n=1 Tax=Nocardioides insulae TaxID=394734 RepID=UPI00040CBDA8|nr:FAD-dependent oxidoreductase [Nocardioides insulae]
MTPRPPRHLAVVGSGVAGLTAAYVASRTCRVTLLEADDRLGGHADTHRVIDPNGVELAVDSGFIVHNRRTYPVLLRLFDELGVATQESEMSLSVSDEVTGLEWAGALGPRGLFPTLDNLRDPAFLRMLAEIPRFHRRARRLLREAGTSGQTLGRFLDAGRFSAYFRRHFIEPLVAAVWSCDPAVALEYPAAYLFTFLEHHGMLGVLGSPTWRTVSGGSQAYVERVAAAVRATGGEIRTRSAVHGVGECADGVRLLVGDRTETYDAVVVATHPDQALALLTDPNPVQRKLLGALPYSTNTALLHTDARLLPRSPSARAAWNFRRPLRDQDSVLVTYDLTRLQRLPTETRYLVTLGGEGLVDPTTVIARREYAHPLYTPDSVAARGRLREVDTERVVFAGAYQGWGFHEDGARSGLEAVERLGVTWPERARPATAYATTITHTRRTPFRRTFRHRSHTWLVDLDHLPDRVPGGGRFSARDHFTGDAATIRAGLDRLLTLHGLDLRGGRALMLAHPRAFGHCFNPITVHWCWADPAGLGRPAATVVEVHNTYGDRHAYVLRADEHGRAEIPKAMYVSPFHGTDGNYRVQAPPPDPGSGRVRVSVSLRTQDGARFVAGLTGAPTDPPRLPLASLRTAALIRLHGIALWARGLPIHPRPHHRQEGAR